MTEHTPPTTIPDSAVDSAEDDLGARVRASLAPAARALLADLTADLDTAAVAAPTRQSRRRGRPTATACPSTPSRRRPPTPSTAAPGPGRDPRRPQRSGRPVVIKHRAPGPRRP